MPDSIADDVTAAIFQALSRAVGEAYVNTGADIPDRHLQDSCRLPPEKPIALVRPGNTAEVAAIIATCNSYEAPLVVQGGLTGLAGGAHPRNGEIVLSLDRMNSIEQIDPVGRTMTVQAGVTLQQVQQAATAAGLFYPVDIGSRGTCTIGGNVATNAGGVQVLRYGMTRRQVLGMEAVLPDGRILTGLNRLSKNNTGYDWKELLIGSEGTLGVITRIVLALQPAPKALQCALCGCISLEAAFELQTRLEECFAGGLLTFEAMWRDYLEIVRPAVSGPVPWAELPPIALLLEVSGGETTGDVLEEVLAQALDDGLLSDAIVAQSIADRNRLWLWRELNSEFGRLQPAGLHFDVSIPRLEMSEAIRQWRLVVEELQPAGRFAVYGHLGDGNLHLAIFPGPDMVVNAEITDRVYRIVASLDGSVSAEHGIGTRRRDALHLSRTEAEYNFMCALKKLLDPQNILGQGRIL